MIFSVVAIVAYQVDGPSQPLPLSTDVATNSTVGLVSVWGLRSMVSEPHALVILPAMVLASRILKVSRKCAHFPFPTFLLLQVTNVDNLCIQFVMLFDIVRITLLTILSLPHSAWRMLSLKVYLYSGIKFPFYIFTYLYLSYLHTQDVPIKSCISSSTRDSSDNNSYI